jgi:hypothetical protein
VGEGEAMRDTIDMAREAGFETMLRKGKILGFDRDGDYTEELKAFEALVRADERDLCAQVVEEYPHWLGMTAKAEIANAIRNRGKT